MIRFIEDTVSTNNCIIFRTYSEGKIVSNKFDESIILERDNQTIDLYFYYHRWKDNAVKVFDTLCYICDVDISYCFKRSNCKYVRISLPYDADEWYRIIHAIERINVSFIDTK